MSEKIDATTMSNMKDRNEAIGLEDRFAVKKLTNPGKAVDCIVLEFDDPIAQKAIEFWANELCAQYPGKDYGQVAADVYAKLESYGYYRDAGSKREGGTAGKDGSLREPLADPKGFLDPAKLREEAKRIREEKIREESGPQTGGVLPSDGVLPRGRQYQGSYTEDERRHRNELAARTLTPVPGMDQFMTGVIAEARRIRGMKISNW